jgi:general secretion pathway protein G
VAVPSEPHTPMNETSFEPGAAPASVSQTRRKGLPTWVWILLILLVLGPVGLVAVSVVAAVALPHLMAARMAANQSRVMQETESIGFAIRSYVAIEGEYPETLMDLVQRDESGAQYLNSQGVPQDPWGRAYLYALPGEYAPEAMVYTLGADGEPGGELESEDIVFTVVE